MSTDEEIFQAYWKLYQNYEARVERYNERQYGVNLCVICPKCGGSSASCCPCAIGYYPNSPAQPVFKEWTPLQFERRLQDEKLAKKRRDADAAERKKFEEECIKKVRKIREEQMAFEYLEGTRSHNDLKKNVY